MAGRWTLTNLTCISETLETKNQLDVIYVDYSKAFDRVNYRILLHELCSIGFSDSLFKVLESYLAESVNVVQVNGYTSKYFWLTCFFQNTWILKQC